MLYSQSTDVNKLQNIHIIRMAQELKIKEFLSDKVLVFLSRDITQGHTGISDESHIENS